MPFYDKSGKSPTYRANISDVNNELYRCSFKVVAQSDSARRDRDEID